MGRAYAEAFVSEVFIKNYFYDIEHEEEFFLLYEVTYEDNNTRNKREKVRKEVYECLNQFEPEIIKPKNAK